MTIKIDRSKCCRLALACTAIAQRLEREASDPETSEDRREIAQSSAEMWYALHDEVQAQIDEFDQKTAKSKENSTYGKEVTT